MRGSRSRKIATPRSAGSRRSLLEIAPGRLACKPCNGAWVRCGTTRFWRRPSRPTRWTSPAVAICPRPNRFDRFWKRCGRGTPRCGPLFVGSPLLGSGHAPFAAELGVGEGVGEVGRRPDCEVEVTGVVLGIGEGLEAVDDDGFFQSQLLQGLPEEEEMVAAKSLAEVHDGGV